MLKILVFIIPSIFILSCYIQKPGIENPQAMIAGFNHSGQESTCLTCHEQNRPTPDHGNKNDCISCHTPQNGWQKAIVFSHNPLPQACDQCHNDIRPLGSIVMKKRNSNYPDQSHFSNKDCMSCHQTPDKMNSTWLFKHQNVKSTAIQFCLPCHYTEALHEHSLSTGYFDQTGRCQECHTQFNNWDRDDRRRRDKF